MTDKIKLFKNETEIELPSLMSLSVESEVNDSSSLRFGSVIADCLNIEVWKEPTDTYTIEAGDTLRYYKVDGETETLYRTFIAQKPTRKSARIISVVGYEKGVYSLDVDIVPTIKVNVFDDNTTLNTLIDLIEATTSTTITVPNDSFFSAKVGIPDVTSLTCRQLLSYIAELSGYIVVPDEYGNLSLKNYRSRNIKLDREIPTTPTGGATYFVYKDGGCSMEEYSTDTVTSVTVTTSSNSSFKYIEGTATDSNPFTISSNLVADAVVSANESNSNIGKNVYDKLKNVSYTPCSVDLFRDADTIEAGDIIQVRNQYDNDYKTMYVMHKVYSTSGVSLDCTGEKNYSNSSSEALNGANNEIVNNSNVVHNEEVKTYESGAVATRTTDIKAGDISQSYTFVNSDGNTTIAVGSSTSSQGNQITVEKSSGMGAVQKALLGFGVHTADSDTAKSVGINMNQMYVQKGTTGTYITENGISNDTDDGDYTLKNGDATIGLRDVVTELSGLISSLGNLIRCGYESVSVASGGYVDCEITFDPAFSTGVIPNVVAQLQGGITDTSSSGYASSKFVHTAILTNPAITNTGCKIRVYNASGSTRTPRLQWIAINPDVAN